MLSIFEEDKPHERELGMIRIIKIRDNSVAVQKAVRAFAVPTIPFAAKEFLL